MRFIQFILTNLLRFKYLGILLLAFLPIIFLDNKDAILLRETSRHYNYPAQIIYILCAIVCFLLFSIRFTSQISCVIVLSLFYNFLFLWYKNFFLTEFLFMTFFYLSIHTILLNRTGFKYIIPLFIAIVIMLKTIGVALLLAYVFYLIVYRLHTVKQKIVEVGITLLIVALTMFVLYLVLPRSTSQYFWEMSGYVGFTQHNLETLGTQLIVNFKTYPGYILQFFYQDLPQFIQVIIQVICMIMFFVGLYFSVKNQFGFIDVAFFAYVICLFILPGNAFRQFLPIVPLFFYYIANSILSAPNFLVLYLQHRFAIWFFLILLFSNAYSIWLIYYGA